MHSGLGYLLGLWLRPGKNVQKSCKNFTYTIHLWNDVKNHGEPPKIRNWPGHLFLDLEAWKTCKKRIKLTKIVREKMSRRDANFYLCRPPLELCQKPWGTTKNSQLLWTSISGPQNIEKLIKLGEKSSVNNSFYGFLGFWKWFMRVSWWNTFQLGSRKTPRPF